MLGDPEAIAEFDESIRLHPNEPCLYNNRGITYYYLGQYERAIEDYDEATRLDPQFEASYYNRTLAYEELGEQELAELDFVKYKKLNPSGVTEKAIHICQWSH